MFPGIMSVLLLPALHAAQKPHKSFLNNWTQLNNQH